MMKKKKKKNTYHAAPLRRANGAVKRNEPPHFAVALWSNNSGRPITIPSLKTLLVTFLLCVPNKYESGTLTCRIDEQTRVQPIVFLFPVASSNDVPAKPSQHA